MRSARRSLEACLDEEWASSVASSRASSRSLSLGIEGPCLLEAAVLEGSRLDCGRVGPKSSSSFSSSPSSWPISWCSPVTLRPVCVGLFSGRLLEVAFELPLAVALSDAIAFSRVCGSYHPSANFPSFLQMLAWFSHTTVSAIAR